MGDDEQKEPGTGTSEGAPTAPGAEGAAPDATEGDENAEQTHEDDV